MCPASRCRGRPVTLWVNSVFCVNTCIWSVHACLKPKERVKKKSSRFPTSFHHYLLPYQAIARKGSGFQQIPCLPPPPPLANRKDVPYPTHSGEHSTGLRCSAIIKQDHLPAYGDPIMFSASLVKSITMTVPRLLTSSSPHYYSRPESMAGAGGGGGGVGG